ncbi:thiamine phosphate synthase [Danxiaibacter flavus]|uniref:Thiamine-phosphate synthase n=1 Tax=Danxiaibacter flavus TaxID=3049108 RepID=A0ABV3Z9M0_9BACT|nr:thiamine phosphate synthase [Chitinophagaceae bacterium DXS]
MAFPHKLYLVTNELACKGKKLLDVVAAAVKGGVDIVQFRDKHATEEVFTNTATELQSLLSKNNIPLIINDRWQVAQYIHAYGVHVGNSDLSPTAIRAAWPQCNCLGYSIEYEEQLNNTEIIPSDYLGISPVFNTSTKVDTVREWGLDGIRWMRKATTKPLVAIGNINLTNVADVIKAGADCVAVVSAICSADDPEKAAAMLRNEIEKNSRS